MAPRRNRFQGPPRGVLCPPLIIISPRLVLLSPLLGFSSAKRQQHPRSTIEAATTRARHDIDSRTASEEKVARRLWHRTVLYTERSWIIQTFRVRVDRRHPIVTDQLRILFVVCRIIVLTVQTARLYRRWPRSLLNRPRFHEQY